MFPCFFQNASLKRYNFRLSARSDFYNDESRVRFTVRGASAVDTNDHAKRLIKELEEAGVPLPETVDKSRF